jgi:2-amino-4-hydroxy-6-hydroxymethyldihydropteridine diphosphokinase
MAKAVLALGSNLGNRRQWLVKALAAVKLTKGIELLEISPIVESKALTLAGVDSTKPKFLNCVAEIETSLKPDQLLRALQAIEQNLGRKKLERWGDRNIDIDILTYSSITLRSADLVIPHPEITNRAFVIVPWYLMDQKAELLGYGSIAKLADIFADQVKLK